MAYRDDRAALEARHEELTRELADATRRAEALGQAAVERERLAEELARVEAKLCRARGGKLPILDAIRIASPCKAEWDDMKGDDRVRFCGSCEKNVYNLSAMPRAEAEALLKEREGDVCVRLYQRPDGTVMTSDCPVGARKKRVRRAALAVAGAGAGLMGLTVVSSFFMMGKPARPDEPPPPASAVRFAEPPPPAPPRAAPSSGGVAPSLPVLQGKPRSSGVR